MMTKSSRIIAYACGTAACVEAGESDFQAYESVDECRANEPCTDDCGVVELSIDVRGYVYPASEPKRHPIDEKSDSTIKRYSAYCLDEVEYLDEEDQIAVLSMALAEVKERRTKRRRAQIERERTS